MAMAVSSRKKALLRGDRRDEKMAGIAHKGGG
jgi:hypothetical protein